MKRHIKLIVMLGVLVVLIAGALIQKQFFPAEIESDYADDGASTLRYAANDVSADNITAFSYEYQGETVSFVLSEGGWTLEGENAPATDSELITAMAVAIACPSGSNKLENVSPEKLADYGLDAPEIKVTVSEGDKKQAFLFGDYNSIADEYYFCSEESPETVYTVSSSAREAFAYTLEDLLVYDTLAEIEADSVTSVSMSDSEKETVISSVKTPTEENEDGYTYSAQRTENGETTDYSYADFYRLAEAIGTWNIDEFVTCDADADTSYGFDAPKTLTVNYTVQKSIEATGSSGGYITTEESFSLILGSKDEEGFYYCKTNEASPMIYKLSSKVFSEIFG